MNYFNAFWVGGLICVVAQILIDKTKLTPARILVRFVVSGVVLGAFDIYKPIIEYAGGGGAVPIVGFGNSLAEGVKKAVDEKGFWGIFIGGVSQTAGGIGASIVFGILMASVFSPKQK